MGKAHRLPLGPLGLEAGVPVIHGAFPYKIGYHSA